MTMKQKLKKAFIDRKHRVPGLWEYLTIKQLRYKFAALKFGIDENRSNRTNLFNLRRNIHRLEKGLSYPTYKNVFATDYIFPTVDNFCLSVKTGELDDSTKNWALSVLNLYFKVIDENQSPVVAKAKHQFSEAIQGLALPN